MINIKKAQKLMFVLTAAFAFVVGSCAPSYANLVRRWEDNGDVTDPANVEPISGSNFGAYNAFTDWQQTQSVSAGAGVSVGAFYSSAFPVSAG
jgi:hypothetical protein